MSPLRRRHHWRILAGAAVLGLVAAACGGDEGDADADTSVDAADDAEADEAEADDAETATDAPADSGGDLRVRIGGDIGVLDPAFIFQIENQTVATHVFNGLMKYDEETNEIIEDLATSVEVADDGLTYTFGLREDVEFHGGYGELTANDVVYSFERIMDEDSGSRYTPLVSGIESVTALDDVTVEFVLGDTDANFLHVVAAFNQGWIVSEAAVEELGDDFTLNPIGTGPFVFDNYVPGDSVRLVAFEDYFEGRPSLDSIEFRVIPEETTAEVALTNGEIDAVFALSNPEVVQRLNDNEDITVHQRTASFVNNLILNTADEPLDNPLVRQAMAHAIDREAIQQDFFQGLRGEAHSPLTSAHVEFHEGVERYEYDPDRARELLEEAGLSDGFDFTLVAPALEPYSDQSVLIQDYLNAVGIRTELNVVERAEYGQVRAEGNIMSSTTSIVAPPNPDAPLVQLFAGSSAPPGMNLGGYNAVDELLNQARATLDDDERLAIYIQIQDQVASDLPAIQLYSYELVSATRDGIDGFTKNSFYTFNASSITKSD